MFFLNCFVFCSFNGFTDKVYIFCSCVMALFSLAHVTNKKKNCMEKPYILTLRELINLLETCFIFFSGISNINRWRHIDAAIDF